MHPHQTAWLAAWSSQIGSVSLLFDRLVEDKSIYLRGSQLKGRVHVVIGLQDLYLHLPLNFPFVVSQIVGSVDGCTNRL